MSYTTPTLTGSIPNPTGQPLEGVLNWTESDTSTGIVAALLLHCDGTNGSTSFPDNSGTGNVVTAQGTAQVDTSAPEFGTGAAEMVAQTDYLSTPCTLGGPLDLSTGDFTVEWWIKAPDWTGTFEIMEIGMGSSFAGGGFVVYTTGGGSVALEGVPAPSGIVTGVIGFSGLPSPNTWYHMAVCSQGGYITCYWNGNYSTSATQHYSSFKWPAGTNLLRFGQGHFTHTVAGAEFDEIRVLQGTAAYPQNLLSPYNGTYSIPSGPFSDGGSSTPASGYDIYRNGVSIATVGQVLTYTDDVPTYGVYTYNVAAYVGGMDVSSLSNDVTLTYAQSIVGFPNCIFDEAIYGGYFGGQLNLVEFTYMPGRTPFEEGATNLIINRYKQEPTDSRQRGVDFTQFAVPGELLQTVAVTGISAQGVPQANTSPLVTPLVITNVIIDPVTQLKFGYTVSGGQNGIEYTVQFTTTTSIQTETLEEIFSINIMIEDSFP